MPIPLPVELFFLITASPFVGSFLGVVIERLPAGRRVAFDRSRCVHCGHALGVRDLVPILSWIAGHGRCRHCGEPIGWFPLAVELAALAVALWAVAVLPGWLALAGAGMGWTLLSLSCIDARRFLLPDVLTLPLALGGLVVAGLVEPSLVVHHAAGAAIGYAVFAGIATIYRGLRGHDGLGLGDAKLLAALGAWVGWEGLPTVVLYAALGALLWVLFRSLRGTTWRPRQRLPFGPFLCLAGWLTWLYGPLVVG